MATYSGPGQFGGQYPTPSQQKERTSSATSSSIHDAGMSGKNPSVPYRSTDKGMVPTGSPNGKKWGELNRTDSPGKDIWGGTELPKLAFSGKVAQKSDYWHQMAEQPAKPGKSFTTKAAPKAPPIPISPSQPRGNTTRPDMPKGSIGVPPSGGSNPGSSKGSIGAPPVAKPKTTRPTAQIGPIIGRGYNGGRP